MIEAILVGIMFIMFIALWIMVLRFVKDMILFLKKLDAGGVEEENEVNDE